MTHQRRATALLLAFLLPVSALAAAADALAALRGKGAAVAKHVQSDSGDSSDDGGRDQPSCSCDCCDVVRRLPSEVSFGAGVKCSPSTQHSSDTCGAQCSPDKEDKVMQDEVVDVERFCFFECKPAAGAKAPDQSQCVAFSEAEAARTVDPAGNPIDPAFLYAVAPQLSSQPPASFFRGGPSSNLLSKGSRVTSRVDPDSVDKAGAKKTAIKGKASSEAEGKDARLEAARLREMEHLKQKELHAALKESGDGVVTMDPFAAIQDLNSAAINARVSAEKASMIASQAVNFYDKGRQKIWKLALGEAGKEVLRWKKYAEDKAKKEYDARFAPTWQSRAVKEAQKASKPYIEGLLRAQESVKLYNEKGFAMANSASELWKQAQFEAGNANKLPRHTIAQNNVAQSDMLDAREKAKEAQHMAMESRQYFGTAAEVRKGIPQYQYNAQKAAALAVATMKR